MEQINCYNECKQEVKPKKVIRVTFDLVQMVIADQNDICGLIDI